MQSAVRWARRVRQGSIQGRQSRTAVTRSAASASSMKSLAPKPMGFFSGRKERKRGKTDIRNFYFGKSISVQGEISNLIDPLLGFGTGPDKQYLFDYLPQFQLLRNNQQTGAGRLGNEAGKVRRHGFTIERNKNSALLRGSRQHLGIL